MQGSGRKESRKRESAKARKSDWIDHQKFAQAAKKWNVCITGQALK
jgi:roadblock/LC7 domain-containing protein